VVLADKIRFAERGRVKRASFGTGPIPLLAGLIQVSDGAEELLSPLRHRGAELTPPAVLLRNATPSVLHQHHIGRVLRSSCNPRRRRLASSRGREPQPGRCPSLWPGDLRNDGISVAAVGADGHET